ncbi:MAG: hypothetical protein ACRC92_21865 [Peptostreptococcaceae bacterium]
MNKSDIDNITKLAKTLDKYGLGLVSFIALMCMIGFQVWTGYKNMEEFKEINRIQVKSMNTISERLTKLETIVEYVLVDKPSSKK